MCNNKSHFPHFPFYIHVKKCMWWEQKHDFVLSHELYSLKIGKMCQNNLHTAHAILVTFFMVWSLSRRIITNDSTPALRILDGKTSSFCLCACFGVIANCRLSSRAALADVIMSETGLRMEKMNYEFCGFCVISLHRTMHSFSTLNTAQNSGKVHATSMNHDSGDLSDDFFAKVRKKVYVCLLLLRSLSLMVWILVF